MAFDASLTDANFGAASEVQPRIPVQSASGTQQVGARVVSYFNDYLIDTGHGVIVDVEAARAVQRAEVEPIKTMLGRVKAEFDLHPEHLIADTA